jgi:hypothetical protein
MRKAGAGIRSVCAAALFLAGARAEAGQVPGRTPGEAADIVPRREIPKEMEKAQLPAPYLRWMLHPLKRGMSITLPVIDTDPNRGITIGFMPIWVFKEEGGERIKQIHAPSISYNKNFLVTPTYRYYLYPQADSTLMARASMGKFEHEAMGDYRDQSFAGTSHNVNLRVQENVDAGNHFFGLGPNSAKNSETNYKADFLLVRGGWGTPIFGDSGWRAHAGDTMQAEKVDNGPLPGFKGFRDTFPDAAAEHRHQSNELRAVLDYDTRDNAVTTTQGAYLQLFNDHSIRGFLSEYDFSRSGFDGRYFYKWPTESKRVTAVNLRFEQLLGNAPFWLLPSLGGKYSQRAYGEGRFVDRSLITFNAEQRFTIYEAKMGGVNTEFEVAPLVGVATVADNPGSYSKRYLRPVVGGAIRAVARPQVVGSVDFGVGQEGLSVFTDINYSF